jgi:hypothetical protein
MNGFFAELRTRKVYRVAAAYAVAAWAIIQFGDIVFPVWDLPSWTMRLVISLVLAGFPLALIFAWVFDFTPEGIRATAPVLAAREERPHRTRRNVAILVLISVAASAIAGFFLLPRASRAGWRSRSRCCRSKTSAKKRRTRISRTGSRTTSSPAWPKSAT